MILTFAEDFTTTTQLDSELIDTPDSGLYWNRGVHPSVNIDNLLALLAPAQFTLDAWYVRTTYNKFETTRKRSDAVTKGGNIYISLTASNVGNDPESDTTNWLLTNDSSLKVRSFLWNVEDNFLSALKLERKLIENQYIYNVGETTQTLANDFSGWVIEPKGSITLKLE